MKVYLEDSQIFDLKYMLKEKINNIIKLQGSRNLTDIDKKLLEEQKERYVKTLKNLNNALMEV